MENFNYFFENHTTDEKYKRLFDMGDNIIQIPVDKIVDMVLQCGGRYDGKHNEYYPAYLAFGTSSVSYICNGDITLFEGIGVNWYLEPVLSVYCASSKPGIKDHYFLGLRELLDNHHVYKDIGNSMSIDDTVLYQIIRSIIHTYINISVKNNKYSCIYDFLLKNNDTETQRKFLSNVPGKWLLKWPESIIKRMLDTVGEINIDLFVQMSQMKIGITNVCSLHDGVNIIVTLTDEDKREINHYIKYSHFIENSPIFEAKFPGSKSFEYAFTDVVRAEIIRTIIAKYLEIKSERDKTMEGNYKAVDNKTTDDKTSYFNTVLFNITRIIQSYGDKGWCKIANSFKLNKKINIDKPEDLEYLASALAQDFVYKNFEINPANVENIEDYLKKIITHDTSLDWLMSM